MKSLKYIIILLATPFIINAQIEVDQNNNVGIGTASPSVKLEVNGNTTILGRELIVGQDAGALGAQLEIGKNRTLDGNAYIDLIADVSSYNDFGGRLIRFAGPKITRFDHRGTGPLQFRATDAGEITLTTNAVERVRVDENGRVGIGTNAPTAKLSVDGGVNKPGGGDWGMFSDGRLKKNIEPFTEGLETLMRINPVRYQYNGLADISDTEKQYVGVIAQELQEVTPYMVSKTAYQEVIKEGEDETYSETLGKKEEYLTVDASAMRYILINAVKELSERVEQLEKIIEGYEKAGK